MGVGMGHMPSEVLERMPPAPGISPPQQVPVPVVVSVAPVIKVHQEATAHHVGHTGHTDEGGVHAVHSFQLHAHLEAHRRSTLGARGGLPQPGPGRLGLAQGAWQTQEWVFYKGCLGVRNGHEGETGRE